MNPKHTYIVRSFAAAAALAAATLTTAQDRPAPSGAARGDATPTTRATTSTGRELSRADRNFLEKAAKSGMKEVEVSQAVLGRLTNQSVQQFAQMMVNDHTAANTELKALAAQKGVALTDETERYTQKWSDNKRNLDKDYVDEMEDDHKDAIDLFEKATKSDDPDIAAFARKTLPKLQQHREQLRTQIKPALDR
jgi:putative membrane protein